MQWIACMAHIKHDQIEYIKGYIDNRFDEYIIAMETSAKVGEHMHFLLLSEDPSQYHKFAQNVFKQKYKLRGKAVKGKCRQYGKLKVIEDIHRMMMYTVKDKNCIIKVKDKKAIEKALEESFQKVDNLGKLDKIMEEYINENKTQNYKPDIKGHYEADGFAINRYELIKHYTYSYFTIFERVPSKNMIINAVIRYFGKSEIGWYLSMHGKQFTPFSTEATIYFKKDIKNK